MKAAKCTKEIYFFYDVMFTRQTLKFLMSSKIKDLPHDKQLHAQTRGNGKVNWPPETATHEEKMKINWPSTSWERQHMPQIRVHAILFNIPCFSICPRWQKYITVQLADSLGIEKSKYSRVLCFLVNNSFRYIMKHKYII